MDSMKDDVSFWATVLGTVVGIVSVLQSRAWLVIVGLVAMIASIGTLMYAERQREKLQAASVRIGDVSIDSLNVATLRRRLNRNLVVQRAQNLAVIDGEDLDVMWRVSGYCRAERETALEFSVDGDANTPYASMDCVAFDVRRDPQRRRPIRPVLVGPDGISKKVSVLFTKPPTSNDPFLVSLRYRIPGCMKPGTDYYTASLSFDQETLQRYSVRLSFKNGLPKWVHVYECGPNGSVTLLKNLPYRMPQYEVREYLDNDENIPARGARVYLFPRPSIESRDRPGLAGKNRRAVSKTAVDNATLYG